MEQPAFALNSALGQWRAGFTALTPDDLAELEGHLLDSMAELQRTGLSDEEAFSIAAARLGNPAELAAEIAGPPPSPRPVTPAVAPPRRARGCLAKLSITFGILLILLGVAGVIGMAVMPKKYRAKVVLEVQPSQNFSLPGAFNAITSRPVLDAVVTKFDLVKRWNLPDAEAAYFRLEDMIDADEERGTDLINLLVLGTDSRECAELANAVAEQYIENLKQREKARIEAAFQKLDESRTAQEAKVEAARNKMQALADKFRIEGDGMRRNYKGDKGLDTGEFIDASILINQHEARIEKLRSQLESLGDKTGDNLIAAGAAAALIDTKNKVCGQYLVRTAQLQALLEEGRGPKHPEVVKLQTALNAERVVVEQHVKSLRDSLKDDLRNAELILKNIHKIVEEEKAEKRAYQEAKDDYELQMDLLQKMIEGQETERITLLMPKSPVTIHEFATPPLKMRDKDRQIQVAFALSTLLVGVVFIIGGLLSHPWKRRQSPSVS